MRSESPHPPNAGHTSSEKWAENRLKERRSQTPRQTQRPPNPNTTKRSSWWPVFWLICLILITTLMISRQLSTPAAVNFKQSTDAILSTTFSDLIHGATSADESNGKIVDDSQRWSFRGVRNELFQAVFPLDISADQQALTASEPQNKPRLIVSDNYLPPRVSLASAAAQDQWVMDFLPDEEGIYRMRVWPDTITWTSLGGIAVPMQFRLETKMRINPLASEGYGGFLARYQDEENYYLFLLDGDGHYQVLLQSNGVWFLAQEWTNKAAIHLAGARSNTIALEDSQNSLRLYVNGVLVSELDPVLPAGYTGFVAGTNGERTAEIDYYGLTLYELY